MPTPPGRSATVPTTWSTPSGWCRSSRAVGTAGGPDVQRPRDSRGEAAAERRRLQADASPHGTGGGRPDREALAALRPDEGRARRDEAHPVGVGDDQDPRHRRAVLHGRRRQHAPRGARQEGAPERSNEGQPRTRRLLPTRGSIQSRPSTTWRPSAGTTPTSTRCSTGRCAREAIAVLPRTPPR